MVIKENYEILYKTLFLYEVMQLGKNRNNTITNMGIIGALLVVLLHLKPEESTYVQYVVTDFVYNKSGFLEIAVPMFFGISGYLLVRHTNESNWWKTAVVKRIKTLIVPFYIWTYIYVCYELLLLVTSNCLEISLVTPNPIRNGIRWFVIELLGLDLFHLTPIIWYLRALFLYVLISPVIVIIVKKGLLSICFLCLSLLYLYRYGAYSLTGYFYVDKFLENGVYIQGALPFTLGIILCLRPIKKEYLHILTNTKHLMLIWGVVLILGYITPPIISSWQRYLISVIDVLIVINISMKFSLPPCLTGLSMPLYLTHMLMKWLISYLLGCFNVYYTMSNSFWFWPLKIFIVVGTSLFIAYTIKTRYPRIHKCLYGGR